jgi:ATP-dependent RNA helicase MSS116
MQVQRGMASVEEKSLVQAYVAWLGFYNSLCKNLGWSKADLVQQANFYATECLGLPQPPALMKRTVGMMGLKGVPGIRLE